MNFITCLLLATVLLPQPPTGISPPAQVSKPQIPAPPSQQPRPGLLDPLPPLAAKGYVIFYCNPRGGTGYGEKHLNAIVGQWGTHDYDDYDKPDLLIERRPVGWAIFLHPLGGGDPVGVIYFLDDGRSFFREEPFTEPPLVVLPEDERLAEMECDL